MGELSSNSSMSPDKMSPRTIRQEIDIKAIKLATTRINML